MSLSSIADDPERLNALIDILCGAASADEYVAAQEIVVVQAMLRKLLAIEELPASAQPCIAKFERGVFDLAAAVERLACETDEDAEALLAAAMAVVVSDRFVDSGEFGFIAELADLLGLPLPSQLS